MTTIGRRSRMMNAASGGMSSIGTAAATKLGTSWKRTAITPALLYRIATTTSVAAPGRTMTVIPSSVAPTAAIARSGLLTATAARAPARPTAARAVTAAQTAGRRRPCEFGSGPLPDRRQLAEGRDAFAHPTSSLRVSSTLVAEAAANRAGSTAAAAVVGSAPSWARAAVPAGSAARCGSQRSIRRPVAMLRNACSAARLTMQKKAGNESSLFRPAGRSRNASPTRPRP